MFGELTSALARAYTAPSIADSASSIAAAAKSMAPSAWSPATSASLAGNVPHPTVPSSHEGALSRWRHESPTCRATRDAPLGASR